MEDQITYWTQNNGIRIDIKKMTKRHIINTMDMIREHRLPSRYDNWLNVFYKELKRRAIKFGNYEIH